MKKFIKLTLACLLTLGFVATQGNTAQAAQDRKPYNNSRGHLINGYWDSRASINLKLRHNYWFHSKWQHEMKFRIGGDGAVKMDEEYGNYDPNKFQQMTGAWAMDDNYMITVTDDYRKTRISTTLREGRDVAVEMKRLKKEFNDANVQVGWRFEISSNWNDTITPNNGKLKKLYLAREGRRKSYDFTFTDEGLVEDATNLRGTDDINTDILFPIEENGRTSWSGLQMRVDGSSKVKFSNYAENNNVKLKTKFGLNTSSAVVGGGLSAITGYHGYGTSYEMIGYLKDRLNKRNLSYGDVLYFQFYKPNEYNYRPSRIGKNTNVGQYGLFDLTNETGTLKITRYGFLTDTGYKVSYRN